MDPSIYNHSGPSGPVIHGSILHTLQRFRTVASPLDTV